MQPAMAGAGAAAAATAAVGLAPDLQKRVKIMAEHVARNGPEFEATVKAKNAGSAQFAFLAGGEGAEYYQQLLQAHRAAQFGAVAGQAAAAAAAAPAQAGGEGAELAELAARWREPQVLALGPEGDRQLQEIVASLEQIASRDAIRAGRAWIEANVGAAHAIAGNLMKRIVYLPTCAHRLHILFLLHDVLQTEIAKQEPTRPLITAFKPYLVWMLRPSYQLAQSMSPDGEDSTKILKLLGLWAERGILTSREAEEVKMIVTAKELPAPVPVQPQLPGSTAPTLLQQVGAQLTAQQAARPPAPQGQLGTSVLGILQQLPQGMARPPGQALPVPGFTGVIRPALPTVAGLPQQGGQTPETVPVGVMATMLKQVSKRGKDLHTAFVPYKPLDPLYTPQTLPPVAPPTARLMERLAEYYDIVGGDAGREERLMALPAPQAPAAAVAPAAAAPPAAAAQPAIALGNVPAPAAAAAAAGTSEPERPGQEEAAGGERKARRIMCASGSRSRSRSRSPSQGRSLAAAAALAGAAVPPPRAEGSAPSPRAEPAPTAEAPKRSSAIQAID